MLGIITNHHPFIIQNVYRYYATKYIENHSIGSMDYGEWDALKTIFIKAGFGDFFATGFLPLDIICDIQLLVIDESPTSYNVSLFNCINEIKFV